MKRTLLLIAVAVATVCMRARNPLPKVYDESVDPMTQIDKALAQAKKEQKNVIVQLGGNWCVWCLRFADFITKDTLIDATIRKNYEYIHVNTPRRGTPQAKAAEPLQRRLDNAGRFGYPVLVVLGPDGKVLHIQDSSFLESGQSYDSAKVLRFLRNWTPACTGQQ